MQVIVTNPELRKDISVTVTIGGSAPYYDRLNVNIDQKGNPNASRYYCLEMSAPNDVDAPDEPNNVKFTNKELETLLR